MKDLKFVLICLVILVAMSSCNRFEEGPALTLLSAKARLTGEWEIVDFVGPDSEDYLDYLNDGYEWFFEFEKEGDGAFGYRYDGYQYSNLFDWELDEDELEISFIGNSITRNWEIQRLTNKELEMQLKGQGVDIMTWVFEKED